MSTKIEWTNETWNPVTGCTKVSQGCKHCYAERLWPKVSAAEAKREGSDHARPFTQIRCHPERLLTPLRWTTGKRVFVNSMSDLFHEDVPFEFIDLVFSVMACTTRHTYQILTKRPQRMLEYFTRHLVDEVTHITWADGCAVDREHFHPKQIDPLKVWPQWTPYLEGKRGGYDNCGPGWPLSNVWLGVSVEDQQTADERIPLLLSIPDGRYSNGATCAWTRFISAEPLLGPIDLLKWKIPGHAIARALSAGKGAPCLDWVIAGGESGPKARPSHPDWFRIMRDQCAAAGVPFFFKQWGEWSPIDHQPNYFTDRLYRSNRVAKLHEDQSAIDDCYGRRCTVAHGVIHHDASLHDVTAPGAFQHGSRAMTTFKVGKKAAGRELDGVTHDAYPAS